MLTVTEFARRFGLEGGTRRAVHQRMLRRIRALERATGREILIQRGAGEGRRLMLRTDQLLAAIEGDAKIDSLDAMAAKIAEVVQAMDARHTEMSVSLAETRRRLAAVEARLAAHKGRAWPKPNAST